MTYFELPKMIKRIPVSARSRFFEAVERAMNVSLAFDKEQVTKHKIEPILEALKALPQGDLDKVKSTFYWIHTLSENAECVTLLSHILRGELGGLPEEYQEWSMLERVIYVYSMLSGVAWEKACALSHVHEHPKREWSTLDLQLPHAIQPETSELACFALKEAVCDLMKRTEFRGGHGKCQHTFRSDRNQDYFVIYMNDHPLNRMTWAGGDEFEPTVSKDAFEVDFIYERSSARLSVHIKGPGEMRKRLAEVWAQQILGIDYLRLKDKETYKIQHFKRLESSLLTIPPASCITEAKVVELSTFLFDEPKSRRVYTEGGEKNLYHVLTRELNSGYVSLLDMTVRRVIIRIKYRAGLGDERIVRLRLTPTTSNFQSLPEEIQADVERFIAEQEICHVLAA